MVLIDTFWYCLILFYTFFKNFVDIFYSFYTFWCYLVRLILFNPFKYVLVFFFVLYANFGTFWYLKKKFLEKNSFLSEKLVSPKENLFVAVKFIILRFYSGIQGKNSVRNGNFLYLISLNPLSVRSSAGARKKPPTGGLTI